MRFRSDNNLRLLAIKAGKSEREFATAFMGELLSRGLIQDDTENYGSQLCNCEGVGDKSVGDFVDALRAAGVEKINGESFDAMCVLVVMGMGNCPECGGTISAADEVGVDMDEYEDFQGNYNCDVHGYEYKCPICGHIHKTSERI